MEYIFDLNLYRLESCFVDWMKLIFTSINDLFCLTTIWCFYRFKENN